MKLERDYLHEIQKIAAHNSQKIKEVLSTQTTITPADLDLVLKLVFDDLANCILPLSSQAHIKYDVISNAAEHLERNLKDKHERIV